MAEIRHLVVVLGDQLDRQSSAWDGFDPARDRAWMCEAAEEATHVWCSQQRLVLFLSATRHFKKALDDEGMPLEYFAATPGSLAQALSQTLAEHRVQRIVLTEPGDWRVLQALRAAAAAAGVPLDLREDRHFLCSGGEFSAHAKGRKQLRMEYFYLLHPREVIVVIESEFRAGRAPLAAAEGFIRQLLGWREYVRGIYWLRMPHYASLNVLGATEDLPAWYWTGDVPMRCLRDAIQQTLRHGYAHHIQRLMVTGLYALLHGIRPQQLHGWYLSVYVDAVEWVELPNTLGMSQYADGGLMTSKPYAATGKYIERMSDHCRDCHFDPAQRTGPCACPYTTLYWDFLLRHEVRFAGHPRMALQVKNVVRLDASERAAITRRATAVRRGDWDAA